MRRTLFTLTLIAACKPAVDDVVLTPRTGCDPLDTAKCALPFPSAYFLEPAATETGVQVAWTPESGPENVDGVVLNPSKWNEKDGFSIASPMMAFFPNLSLEGHVHHSDIGAFESDDALTILLDLDTGERVPHWVELDGLAENADEQLTILRPAIPLDWDHDYVVAFRSLKDTSGAPIPPSAAFAALRDGTPTTEADVEDRRARFDADLFPALEEAGFPRSELTLAWDFHTNSRQNTLGRLEHIRDDALAFVQEGPIDYRLTKVEDSLESCATGGHIARHIEGEFTMPLWVDNDLPPAWLTRGPDGMPVRAGETAVSFTMRVPCSVALDPDAGPITLLQYGHGLLGGHDEVEAGWLADLSDEMRYVPFGVSWTGMKSEDYAAVSLIVALDPSDFGSIPERSHQGMAEAIVALELMRGQMVDDENLVFDGQKILEDAPFAYYGNSQGGIMGGALMGLSPVLTRGVLGVGGGPYSLLLPRSHDFDDFFRIFDQKFDDSRDIALIVQGLLQQLWDPTESSGWLHDMDGKSLLLQVGIGDAQVSTLGAQITARGWGAKLVDPPVRDVWGLEAAAAGFTGSALVEWEYSDVPAEPDDQTPPNQGTDVHECVRREPRAKQQLRDFIATGVVNNYCDGPCIGLRAGTCD